MSEKTQFRDVVKPLHKNGYKVLPLQKGKKFPSIDEWSTVELTTFLYKGWLSNGKADGGAGIRLGDGLIALDIDIDDEKMSGAVRDSAEYDLGFAPARIGRAPRSALFYRCDEQLKKRAVDLFDADGNKHKVELLAKGQQVAAFGIHPDTKAPYYWDGESLLDVPFDELPTITSAELDAFFDSLVDVVAMSGWTVGGETGGAVSGDDDLLSMFDNHAPPLDINDADIIDAIDRYNVPDDYDGWFRFLCACYHQSSGSDRGLEWAHKGCSLLANYDADEIDTKWHSGTLANDGSRKPVTFASVLAEVGVQHKERKAVAVVESQNALDVLMDTIESADAPYIKTDLVGEIKSAKLDKLDKEIVFKAVQTRLKTITGQMVNISSVRKMFTTRRARPEWCEDWVYVNSHGSFFSVDDRNFYKREAFDVKQSVMVPPDDNGVKMGAYRYISENGYVDVAVGTVYWPGVDDVVCTLPSTQDRMVNTFDHRSVPTACDKVSDEGAAAIKIIVRHLEVLTGSADDAQTLLMWLAHNVQYPGKKLLWSPMIQSIQGVGKSFLGRLLMAALGDSNVGTVSPRQAISDNNGWATGKCVNVLEELKISGHNRHEAANALKPLITDPYIQIQDKYVKAYNTMNTTNYLCFTNHKDAIPLEDNDRRWWVVFCPLVDLAEIGARFKMSQEQYLDELWGAVAGHPGCLRRWLLDINIADGFLKLKQAPMTLHKKAMIATEKGTTEWLDEVAELIAEGSKFYGSSVVSTKHLFAAASLNIDDFHASNTEKSIIMKKLGYMKHGNIVAIGGEKLRFWTKPAMTNGEIRRILADAPF